MSEDRKSRSFAIGESAFFTKTITEADIDAFGNLSGDRNPIHFDEEYSALTRFKQRIAHGLLSTSFISTVIGMQLPGPGAIYLSQEVKFLKPVFIGDAITARAEVTAFNEQKRVITLKTECVNQDGVAVITGEAKVLYEPVD